MTPANAELLEQLRAALDSPPNARAISDLQALRDYLRNLFGPGDDKYLLACVDEVVCRNATRDDPVSMSTLSDAADAKQLRDRVRQLEADLRAAEAEAKANGDAADLADYNLRAMVESESADLQTALDENRRLNAELVGLPQAVAVTELASSMSVEEIAKLRAELAEANVRLASWRTWARATYDSIAPIDERHEDHRWYAMSDDQVRINVSAQVELLQCGHIQRARSVERERRFADMANEQQRQQQRSPTNLLDLARMGGQLPR